MTTADSKTQARGRVRTSTDGPAWADDLYRTLRAADYTQFAYVPDAGHQALIESAIADPSAHAIPLANEAEGIGIIAGADLGHQRAVLLMQSGGVGNCANMLSLVKHCAFPFLTIVTMRGDWGEQNPWQYPMGQAVEPVLASFGVQTMRVDTPDQVVPTADVAVGAVERAGRAIAILLTQRLIGVKKF